MIIVYQAGFSFYEAVFNEIVKIVELNEGLDGETVFLYIFMSACVILLLVGGQQLLSSFGRKTRSRKTVVEVGTSYDVGTAYILLLLLKNFKLKCPQLYVLKSWYFSGLYWT